MRLGNRIAVLALLMASWSCSNSKQSPETESSLVDEYLSQRQTFSKKNKTAYKGSAPAIETSPQSVANDASSLSLRLKLEGDEPELTLAKSNNSKNPPQQDKSYKDVVLDLIQMEITSITGEKITIPVPTERRILALSSFQESGFHYFDSYKLPVGIYTQIRLVINEAKIMLDDGTLETIKIPSGETSGLKFTSPFIISRKGATTYEVHFDLAKSIRYNEGQGWMLSPVLKIGEIIPKANVPADQCLSGNVVLLNEQDVSTFTDISNALSHAVPGTTVFIGDRLPLQHISIEGKNDLHLISPCQNSVGSFAIVKSKDIKLSNFKLAPLVQRAIPLAISESTNITADRIVISPFPFALPAVSVSQSHSISLQRIIVDYSTEGHVLASGMEIGNFNNDVKIQGAIIKGTAGDGITVGGSTNVSIFGSEISNNAGHGLSIAGDADLAHNIVSNNGLNGMKVQGSWMLTLNENLIVENGGRGLPTDGYGLALADDQATASLHMTRNTFKSNRGLAISGNSSRDIRRYDLFPILHETYSTDGSEGLLFYDGMKSGQVVAASERLDVAVFEASLPNGIALSDIKVEEKPRAQVLPQHLLNSHSFASDALKFSPSGVTFASPLRVRLKMAPEMANQYSAKSIKLAYYNENLGRLEIVSGSYFDPASLTLTAYINHFSTYIAVATEAPVPPPPTHVLPQSVPEGFPHSFAYHPYVKEVEGTCSWIDVSDDLFALDFSPDSQMAQTIGSSTYDGFRWLGFPQSVATFMRTTATHKVTTFLRESSHLDNKAACRNLKKCILGRASSLQACANDFSASLTERCVEGTLFSMPLEGYLRVLVQHVSDETARNLIYKAIDLIGLIVGAVGVVTGTASYEQAVQCMAQAVHKHNQVNSSMAFFEAYRVQQATYEQDVATMKNNGTCRLDSPDVEVYFDQKTRVRISVLPETGYRLFEKDSGQAQWHTLDYNSFYADLGPGNHEVRFTNLATGNPTICHIAVSEKRINQRMGITSLYATYDFCGDQDEQYHFNFNSDTDGHDVRICYRKSQTFKHITDVTFAFNDDPCPSSQYVKNTGINFNHEAGGDRIYMCTLFEDTREENVKPLQDIIAYETEHVVDECPSEYSWIPVDLNQGVRKRTCTWRGCGDVDVRNIYACKK